MYWKSICAAGYGLSFVISSLCVFVVEPASSATVVGKEWVRSSTEIPVPEYHKDVSPGICGGDGWSDHRVLTAGSYAISLHKSYAICSGEYHLNTTINFDVPPETITAGNALRLNASGTMSGYQDCCFLFADFDYSGNCFTSTPLEDIHLNLRVGGPGPISIPGEENATGWQGSVGDSFSQDSTMRSSGTECVIQANAVGLGPVTWTYQSEDKLESDLEIVSISGGSEFSCESDESHPFTVTFRNNGPEAEWGSFWLTNSLQYDGTDLFDKNGREFGYESSTDFYIAGGEEHSIQFSMRFDRAEYSTEGIVLVTIHSNARDRTDPLVAIKAIKIDCGPTLAELTASNFLLTLILAAELKKKGE